MTDIHFVDGVPKSLQQQNTPLRSDSDILLSCFEHPDYIWRSVGGLLYDSGWDYNRLWNNLKELGDAGVIISTTTDQNGLYEAVYTTYERWHDNTGWLGRIISFLKRKY